MAPVNNAHFTPARSPGGGGGGTPTGGGTSGYFVEAGDVEAGSNSSAGTYITLTIAGVSAYQAGMVARFRNTVRNLGPVSVRINSLDFQRVLAPNNEAFGQFEFHHGYLYTLVYDGSGWVAVDAVDAPLTIIEPSEFSFDASSNLITVSNADAIRFYDGVAQILFRMEGTNTDDVRLQVGSGTSVPVMTSRGMQIPAGYLRDGIYVRATFSSASGAWVTDVEGPQELKGRLLATYGPIPAKTYWGNEYVNAGWSIEAGVTGFTLKDIPADERFPFDGSWSAVTTTFTDPIMNCGVNFSR